MAIGEKYSSEVKVFKDPVTGVQIRQLTDYRCHSNHLYFTNPGWYDEGRRLVVESDRDNSHNLISIELATGELTQLTDLSGSDAELQCSCVNPKKSECYFQQDRKIIALDLESLQCRTIFETPDGFNLGLLNCTADGKYVSASLNEDLTGQFRMDMNHEYIGFADYFKAGPVSRLEIVSVDGSGSRTVLEEKSWINHVNPSPTQESILTFCHEGPWIMVDHRIWGLDINDGGPWKIRPYEKEKNDSVGHEYWYADGVTLGYHGRYPDKRQFIGHIRYDNTEKFEIDFPHLTGHTHSNDHSLIVGDGGSVVRLWKWNGQTYEGPRMLCEHRCSAHIQRLHVHPRFTPDGKAVLFTSDMSDYGNVYLADVGDFDSLPPVED